MDVSVTDSGLELKMIPTPTTSLHINSLYITATTTCIYICWERLREWTVKINSFWTSSSQKFTYIYSTIIWRWENRSSPTTTSDQTIRLHSPCLHFETNKVPLTFSRYWKSVTKHTPISLSQCLPCLDWQVGRLFGHPFRHLSLLYQIILFTISLGDPRYRSTSIIQYDDQKLLRTKFLSFFQYI
jgi:hypothetical protein